MRRVGLITLIDRHGNYLLQHRDEGIKTLPGYWAFFGGKIEENETPEEAMYRETKEELGISLVDPKFVLETTFYDKYVPKGKKWVWIAYAEKQTQIVLGEGQGYGYFTLDEIRKMKVIDHDIETFEAIHEFVNKN